MQTKKNLGVNAILNVVRQCLKIVFPLVTYPYALRVLGADGIGKVSYGNSIISYFSLIAMLGITNYAIREGTRVKHDKDKFQAFTKEVFTINLISTTIAYALLVVFVFFAQKLHSYALLIGLQSVSIIFSTLGVDWVNSIYEDYLLLTIRSVFTHVVSLVLLFVFVKTSEDYYVYALLTVITNGLVCISNWFYCRKYTKIGIAKKTNYKKHLKPMLILFANSIAVTIYINIDTTMLGWIKGDYYTGLYTVSVNVYAIVKNLMCAIFVVTMPRLAYYAGNKLKNEFKELYTDLWCYMSLLLIPVGFGIICIAPEIMVFMGGEEFVDASLSLQILSIALILAIFGGIVTGCFNITNGREKETLKATLISAALNCMLNLYFIPKFNYYGAAVTTLISEGFVFLFCFARISNKREFMDINKIKRCIGQALAGVAIMMVYAYAVRYFIDGYVMHIVLIVPGCIMIYAVILLLFKNPYLVNNLMLVKRKLFEKKG